MFRASMYYFSFLGVENYDSKPTQNGRFHITTGDIQLTRL